MRTCYRSHTSVCGALTVVFGVLIVVLIVNLKRSVCECSTLPKLVAFKMGFYGVL